MPLLDPGVTGLERVQDVKRTLGGLVRKCDADIGVSTEEFKALAARMRHHLDALEVQLGGPPATPIMALDLADGVGRELGRLLDSGDLKPARDLLPEGVQRARTYGRFTVIDGDQPFDAPFSGE